MLNFLTFHSDRCPFYPCNFNIMNLMYSKHFSYLLFQTSKSAKVATCQFGLSRIAFPTSLADGTLFTVKCPQSDTHFHRRITGSLPSCRVIFSLSKNNKRILVDILNVIHMKCCLQLKCILFYCTTEQ